MGKYVLKVEKIEVGKPQVFDIPEGSKVTVNHFQFEENQISKIEVKRIKSIPDTIFINLYSGNVKIGNVVTKESYQLEVDTCMRYYYLDPAGEY